MNKTVVLKYLGYGDQFEVYEEINHELSNGILIHIPKGFITDMASTPRLVWNLFPPFGTYGYASVIHDYLYITPEIIVSRSFADAEYKRIMIDSGTNIVIANIFYTYVKLLGWFNWKKFKERN